MDSDRQRGYEIEILVPAYHTLDVPVSERPLEVEQRASIFFDEVLPVHIVVDVPSSSQARLDGILSRLEIDLNIWAVSAHDGKNRHAEEGAATRELLSSQPMDKTRPTVVTRQHEDIKSSSSQLVWRRDISIGRPRTRLIEPSIVFVAHARLPPPHPYELGGDLLQPFVGLEHNVLAPLNPIAGRSPYLPASRLQKPTSKSQPETQTLKFQSKKSVPIKAYPAVQARLRYTKSPTLTVLPSVIASLDIEAIPFVSIQGTIEAVDLSLTNGTVTPLMPGFFPHKIRSKECVTCLYKLETASQSPPGTMASDASPSTAHGNAKVLSISIAVSIDMTTATDAPAKARLGMSWTTNINFSPSLDLPSGALLQPVQPSTRQSSLNFAPYPAPNIGGATISKLLPQHAGNAKTSSSLTTHALSTSVQYHPAPTSVVHTATDLARVVSVSFTAPAKPVIVGQKFVWKVLVVNNSDHVTRLVIIPLSSMARSHAVSAQSHRHAPRSSSMFIHTITDSTQAVGKASLPVIARPVLTRSELSALHSPDQSPRPIETDIVTLTPEVRTGSIMPGQCTEVEIGWMGYRAGVFDVDTIRIVDLARERATEDGLSGSTVRDIRELPEIVIVEDDTNKRGEESR